MSRRVTAPKTQKRLTNVVYVRVQKGHTKFEIACYPNKVEEWRRGVYVASGSYGSLLKPI